MPTPRHFRVRFGGQLYADAHWSVSVALARPLDDVIPGQTIVTNDLDEYLDNVVALNQGLVLPGQWFDALSQSGTLTYVRMSLIGTNGREEEVSLREFTTPISGNGGAGLPAQSCVTLSLRTGRPGGSYRGRLYLPALGLTLSAGRLSPTRVQSLAEVSATFISSLGENLPGALNALGLKPAVVSTVTGRSTAVKQIAVGNRLDSQRRRAEAQKEVYGVAAVPQ